MRGTHCPRHCERSEAIQNLSAEGVLDCFVARASRNDEGTEREAQLRRFAFAGVPERNQREDTVGLYYTYQPAKSFSPVR